MILQKNFYVDTTAGIDLIDIYHEVHRVVLESKIKQGLVTLVVPLAMGGFVVLDSHEESLARFKQELAEFLRHQGQSSDPGPQTTLPQKKSIGKLRASEMPMPPPQQNMSQGLLMTLVGRSLSLPLSAGAVSMDPWDHIYLLDLDAAGRRREFIVQVMGDGAGQTAGQPMGRRPGMRGGPPGQPPPGPAVKV